ncbi:breast cancer type 2 susceptibility protein homolog [Bradysia coprophila]|uniref:breast cancer type 2 susceptibility protein homolog n=1 Tax=Bradysia coprophila TaxID=38358 RepID=UPI00187D9D5B|nr:breast cancer type 2 susceptibility protein homolog [Bradysia coprophila]
MDEEIEASPTSQRKRKKLSRRRAIEKISLTGGDNQEHQDTIEDSDFPFCSRMWQSAYLLEENDKVQFVPKNGRSHRTLGNEFRMSGPADFLSVSQLCAARATHQNDIEESEWDVTESQFRKVDDAIKEFHESEIKQIDNSVRDNNNTKEVPNVSTRLDGVISDVAHNEQSIESATVGRDSLKRPSSVLESILSDWSSPSPTKIQKTQSEVVQLSPKFKFNRKRCKRTYCRMHNSDHRGKLVNDLRKASPATSPVYNETVGANVRPELCQKPNDPADANDDDDFDESMNIVDNIQNLSKFFSQSCETALDGNNIDATESTAMNLRSVDLTVSRTSLDDEEDFLGFDGPDLTGEPVSITLPEFFVKCYRKFSALESITLPERFNEFDTDSESSYTPIPSHTDNTEQLLLMEDDDLFANYQTQQYISKEEVDYEKPTATISANEDCYQRRLFNGKICTESNYVEMQTEAATRGFGRRTNIFDDIDREFDITSNPRNTEPSTSCLSFPIRPQCRETEHNPNVMFAGFSIVSGNSAVAGFTTAGGVRIPVASELILKKTNIFDSVNVSEDEIMQMNNYFGDERKNDVAVLNQGNLNLRTNSTYGGFATARGKRISVSPTMISKKADTLQDISVNGDELMKMGVWNEVNDLNGETNDFSLRNWEFNPGSMCKGFTTARGRNIPVSSDMMLKKTNIFDSVNVNEDDLKKMNIWIDDEQRNNEFSANSKAPLTGFATARGKQIPVPSTMISKHKNILQSIAIAENELNGMDTWISHRDVIDATNDSLGQERNDFNPKPTFKGFTTAGGKHMSMPSAQLSKIISIFDDVNVTPDELQNMNHWIDDCAHSKSTMASSSTNESRKTPISRSLFSNPVHNVGDNPKKQWNSTDLFREVTNTPQREADNLSKKFSVDTFIKPSPMRKMSMMNSLRKLETSKENAVAKPVLSIDDKDSVHGMFNATSTPTSCKTNVCVTPTNNLKTYSQIGRESAAAIMEDDELTLANPDVQLKEHTPGFASGFMAELTASSTPVSKSENFRSRLKQRRLVEKFDDIAREDDVESNILPETIKIKVSPQVKSLRTTAIKEQQQSIAKKTNVKAVPSSLFISKLTSTKVNWKEFVEHSRPVNKPVTGANITNNVLNVTVDNATKFRFNAWEHYSDEVCRENINGIHLQDDIVVIMDENCQIGLTEISTAFLSCPSVDPALIHTKWIENNMKWIVVKLAAMERSFPHRFAGKALTLENLMLQMKYRYEREIDRVERSAIRKICEMDDVPEKRMILFVAGITKSSSEYEVELSDGWYSLSSTLDFGMKRLVNEGKIKIGTKLVIQGANTINLSEGCHPLDVPANVKLKIHANSTRRARWDSTLGYCENPEPFKISLRSVWGNGGNITKLRICVLRVYPVVYIDPKNLADVHSEKVERRRSINDEREKSTILEKIINEVTRDFEEEEKCARYENRPRKIIKLAELSSITDPAYLCELLDNDNDPERIEGELTNTQKTMVLNHKEKVNCLRSEEINARVKKKLAAIDKGHKKFVPLLRFKITDEMFYDKTAVVTVWKPTEEILSQIKEESVFDLTGSSSRGAHLSELQIYAGRNANFRKLNVVTRVPRSLLRRHISISEIVSIDHLALNELDTTGFVIHVGESLHSLQPVYIADSNHNIMCINFWQSIKDFAYEDVLQPKRFLAIKNLQWRKSSNSKSIPCTYTTEYTLFIENPQSAELSSAITTLKEQFANVDVNEFIESCMEKVRSFNSSCLSTPIHSNNSSSLLQSTSSLLKTPTDFSPRPGRSSLSNQSRIEMLNKYGDGMATPPLKIDILNKSFKLPVTNL